MKMRDGLGRVQSLLVLGGAGAALCENEFLVEDAQQVHRPQEERDQDGGFQERQRDVTE